MQYHDKITILKTQLQLAADEYAKMDILLELAYESRHNEPENSLGYANEALQFANQFQISVAAARAMLLGGTVLCNLYRYDEARKWLHEGLAVSEGINDLSKVALAYNQIALSYDYEGSYERAVENHLLALHLREKLNDLAGVADSKGNIGVIRVQQGNYAEALSYGAAALHLFEELKQPVGLGNTYGLVGVIYRELGDYQLALKNFLLAVKFQEELGNHAGLGEAYQNIGNIYVNLGNYVDAFKYRLLTQEIFEKTGNKKGIAACYAGIGNIQYLQGHHNQALESELACIKLASEIGAKHEVAIGRHVMGVIYCAMGEYTSALTNQQIAAAIFDDLGESGAVASSYVHMGEAYTALNEYPQAIETLTRAIELAKNAGQKDVLKDGYKSLANAFEYIRDYKNALENYRLYADIKDQLLNETSHRQITEMKTIYETEKKDKQIEIEYLRNVELKDALDKLQDEKERSENLLQGQLSDLKAAALQAQMNPHFVFNSLSAIQQYIWQSDPAQATEYLSKFAKLIRMVLDHSRRDKVTLEQDLSALDYYIQLEALRFENKFKYQINYSPEIDKRAILLPPMIIQPFVENSITHGLSPLEIPGLLIINIWQTKMQVLYIAIQDNGIGRKRAGELKSGKEKTHESVALKLTQERLEKMHGNAKIRGKVKITDLYDEECRAIGTKVNIELPIESKF